MKRIFGLLFASCLSLVATAQQYNMSTTSVTTCSGYFYDPGGAANYYNNANDTMTFTSSNGNRLVFTFSSISLYGPYDRLEVYDGPSTAYQPIGTYYTTINPITITSTGASLTFVFISDNLNTYPGWVASISCGGPVIPLFPMTNGTATVCEGLFFDSGGMFGNYQDNEDREMTFTSASGEYLNFDFNPNYFNIGVNDSLFIYDGASTSAPLYAIFTGSSDWPGTVTSNTNSFTFRFKSDGVNNETGWQAWITCVSAPNTQPYIAMTSGVRYTCGAMFFDSGGGGDYENNEDRVQTFYSNSGCMLGITFTAMNTEGCCDRLYVYDGPSTASPLINSYGGGLAPPPIQATGNALTFRFISDGSDNRSGWSAYFTCANQPTATITANSPTTICGGDSVILSASPGTSYLWNTGETTQNIAAASSGPYWVTVTNASNCTDLSPMTNVTVNAPASVITPAGPTTFCQGDSVTLAASGGNSYTWSDNSTNSTLSVTQAGTYYVIAEVGACADTSASITVNVNTLPAVTLNLPQDTFCTSSQLFTLSGGSPAGGVYSGPGVSGGQLDPSVAGVGAHTITYTYTDANSCLNTATQSFVVDICNGINTHSANGTLSVAPNPTSDALLITFASGNAVNQIQLVDVTGRVVFEQSTNGQAQVTLSMKTLPSGIYLLRTVGGTSETVRVVKE